ncbi:Scramblase-domain-containing protein [Crassisporium funariophilum]|nr:Scramblase-domain-containing protein [Crassisporium funariophilum]
MLIAIRNSQVLMPIKTLVLKRSGPSMRSISRFPKRTPGVSRDRGTREIRTRDPQEDALSPENVHETPTFASHHPEDGLSKLLLNNNCLVIERQIEMLNVFVGFEQSNKYTISNEAGEPLGYIAEEPRGFLGTLSRQAFATHRPFRAVIMNQEGSPILWIRRPFAWINSRMLVQRLKNHDPSEQSSPTDLALDTFGEVQQIWHPWRRRYDIFLREKIPTDMLASSEIKADQSQGSVFYQVGEIDSGFLAWHFRILNQAGDEIASVDRAFRGIGREVFTDTGRYLVHFEPKPSTLEQAPSLLRDEMGVQSGRIVKELNIDERALCLALAVNIDFDYFSRHSHTGG